MRTRVPASHDGALSPKHLQEHQAPQTPKEAHAQTCRRAGRESPLRGFLGHCRMGFAFAWVRRTETAFAWENRPRNSRSRPGQSTQLAIPSGRPTQLAIPSGSSGKGHGAAEEERPPSGKACASVIPAWGSWLRRGRHEAARQVRASLMHVRLCQRWSNRGNSECRVLGSKRCATGSVGRASSIVLLCCPRSVLLPLAHRNHGEGR